MDARYYRRNASSENNMTTEQDNSYRIQPDKFTPDSKDPFANDLMGRKAQADALVKLATSVSGPAVIAVDAPYGVGKSTFLRMFALSPELRDAADVIEHNAWETEFSDMSFNSLAQKVVIASAQPPDAKQPFKESALPITRTTLPIIGKIAPLFGVDAEIIEVALMATNAAEQLPQKASDAMASLRDFHQKLNERTSQKRIVIIIDELDRCTPGYAIKTLEAIHHVFDSDGITFVLGLHRQQLMESIKAVYGQGFDAEGYLDRFIDMTVPLSASRDDFIKAKLNPQILFEKIPYFKQIVDRAGERQALDRAGLAQRLLIAMPNINARSIDRFAKNLIAVMNVMPSNMVSNAIHFVRAYVTACTALAVKIQSPSCYKAFNEHRASDNDIYNLFGTSQLPLHGQTDEPAISAAILIAAQVDISLAVSSLSDDERRQQISAILAGIPSFGMSHSEPDEDARHKTITLLKTHSPLCEQFSSIPAPIMEWLNRLIIDRSHPSRKLSYWQEVTNIIDLTT